MALGLGLGLGLGGGIILIGAVVYLKFLKPKAYEAGQKSAVAMTANPKITATPAPAAWGGSTA